VIGQSSFEAVDHEREIRREPWRTSGGDLSARSGTNPGCQAGGGCRHQPAGRFGFSGSSGAIALGADNIEPRSGASVELLTCDLDETPGIVGGKLK
jgi:hypothetical protein